MLFGRGKKSKDERSETAGTVDESGASTRLRIRRVRHPPR